MMRYLPIAVLLIAGIIFPQRGGIKGKITDNENPLPFVNISLVSTTYGTSSRDDGTFEIKNIPVGKYEIKFSSVGYETKIDKVNVENNRVTELNVQLKAIVIEVGTVEVRDFPFHGGLETSIINLNPRGVKAVSGTAEDVLRTLQSFPGVLALNDFSSQLAIRGGGPDQNLIIMDDIEIFNPYRLYGVISMFNPDVVSGINLITGGFPAKYGDRLSAVLDVTNREGNTQKNFIGSVSASIVDANVVLEGKNPFDIKGSWIVNSRRTYYDLILEPFVKNAGFVDKNTSFPNFYDIQAKIAIGPYSGNKFLLNGITSRDAVDLVSGENRQSPDSIDFFNNTWNDVLGFAWHYSPNKNLFNKLILSGYHNRGTTNFNSRVLDPSLQRSAFENAVPDTLSQYLLGFKMDAILSLTKYTIDDKFTYLWNDNLFEAGGGVDFIKNEVDFEFSLDPELRAFFASEPLFRVALDNIKSLRYLNRYKVYAQNKFRINDYFSIQPGFRVDYYDILNKGYFAPRVSISYAIDPVTTVSTSWGIYYQSPGYEKQVDNYTLYDLNEKNTKDLQAEKAVHYVVGLEHWLNNEWRFSTEAYYKDFSDLIAQKEVTGTKYFTEPIPGKDLHYRSGWTNPVPISSDSLTQIPVNSSVGESYGIEFFLEKKNSSGNDRLYGWFAYTLAYANRIANGKKIPFKYDQRHTINIVLNYKLNSWLSIGMKWHYGSGFPTNEPVGISPRIVLIDQNYDGRPETPVIATRNGSGLPRDQQEVIYDINFGNSKWSTRLPAYHRLDIRFTAYADYWDLDWTFYLDVINVYNRANVVDYDHYISDDLTLGKEPVNMFPIIPTLGFSVKF